MSLLIFRQFELQKVMVWMYVTLNLCSNANVL